MSWKHTLLKFTDRILAVEVFRFSDGVMVVPLLSCPRKYAVLEFAIRALLWWSVFLFFYDVIVLAAASFFSGGPQWRWRRLGAAAR